MKTIKVGSVLLVQGDKFFLIKSKVGPAKGLWNNPGGKLESGESFKDGAKREAFEETVF